MVLLFLSLSTVTSWHGGSCVSRRRGRCHYEQGVTVLIITNADCATQQERCSAAEARRRSLARLPGTEFVKALISEVETWAEPYGGLTDDIAVIRVERSVR